jgi:DNA-directed RNA polymerase subunit M/transcription elongation factor TFIIS
MYYLKLVGESEEDQKDQLVYYCRNCGHEDATLSAQSVCALETRVSRKAQRYAQEVNKYTKDDPTLPRTQSIKCPSSDCPSNKGDGDREVIYLRYDDQQMRYLYICSRCGVMWKTDSSE